MGRSRTPRGGAQASYHAPHVPRRRRRRVLAHPVRMLPHVAGAAAVAALATPATAVAWVAGLATGRIPRPVERLVTHAHEHFAAVNGTLYLLTDERPPAPCRSASTHPVRLVVRPRSAAVERRDALRRLVAAPAIITTDLLLGVGVLLGTGTAAAVALGTGRVPAPLHRAIAFGTSYHARSAAYLALISDATPRLRERSPADGRPRAPGSGGA